MLLTALAEFFQQFFVYGAGGQNLPRLFHQALLQTRLAGQVGRVASQAFGVLFLQPALCRIHAGRVTEAGFGGPQSGFAARLRLTGPAQALFVPGQLHAGFFFQLLTVFEHFLHAETKGHAYTALILTPGIDRFQHCKQRAKLSIYPCDVLRAVRACRAWPRD